MFEKIFTLAGTATKSIFIASLIVMIASLSFSVLGDALFSPETLRAISMPLLWTLCVSTLLVYVTGAFSD